MGKKIKEELGQELKEKEKLIYQNKTLIRESNNKMLVIN